MFFWGIAVDFLKKALYYLERKKIFSFGGNIPL